MRVAVTRPEEDAGPLTAKLEAMGHEVVMAADGSATGELREFAAMALVRHLAPSGGREGLGLHGKTGARAADAARADGSGCDCGAGAIAENHSPHWSDS